MRYLSGLGVCLVLYFGVAVPVEVQLGGVSVLVYGAYGACCGLVGAHVATHGAP